MSVEYLQTDDRHVPPNARRNALAEYFARHWTGEHPLAVAGGLNGVLTIVVAYASALAFGALLEKAQVPAGMVLAASLTLLYLGLAALWGWYFVGAWRSASLHVHRGGLAVCAGLAKLAVIVAISQLLTYFANRPLPIVSEHVRIALGDTRFGEAEFRLLRDGTELAFSGGINIGTAKEFQRRLEAAPQVRVLHLNSGGGRISEADVMAAEIRQRKLVTYVSDQCHSACTILFLAGRERWLGEHGKLGFHQPHFPGLRSEHVRAIVHQEKRKLLSLGVESDFAAKALSTPNESIWIPSNAELLAAGVLTRFVDREPLTPSRQSAAMPPPDRLSQLLFHKTPMVHAWPGTSL
jgi:hypothetical protein